MERPTEEPRERPRLLLVPEFSELEWVIADRLAEWADIAAYDPPGVGAEPLQPEKVEEIRRGELRIRDLFVERGLAEIDRLGWERLFVVADGWSNATAVRIALERRQAVQGIALGHASLSYDMDGERPPVRREVWAAMRQLIANDHREFVRHGIVQLTRGSVDEALAKQMLERYPKREFIETLWESLGSEREPIGEWLADLDCPILLAQHEGCISFTEEGFEDAVTAFPGARTLRVPESPAGSEAFASALRAFCEEVQTVVRDPAASG